MMVLICMNIVVREGFKFNTILHVLALKDVLKTGSFLLVLNCKGECAVKCICRKLRRAMKTGWPSAMRRLQFSIRITCAFPDLTPNLAAYCTCIWKTVDTCFLVDGGTVSSLCM